MPETNSYYRARYYDAQRGRFISEDPLGAGHPYVYTDNRPLDYSDPLGLFPYWDHKNLTHQAAINAGYTEADASALADQVAGVDFLPGSQETDAEDTNLHAMAGKKKKWRVSKMLGSICGVSVANRTLSG